MYTSTRKHGIILAHKSQRSTENFLPSFRLEGLSEDMHSHAMSAFGKLDMLCWGTIVLLIIGLAL